MLPHLIPIKCRCVFGMQYAESLTSQWNSSTESHSIYVEFHIRNMDLTKTVTCLAQMIDYMIDTCYLYRQNARLVTK